MNQQDVQVKEAGGFESENRHRRIRRQAALHCAQVLAGMKASNIFIMSEGTGQDLDAVLAGTGIEYRKLCQDGKRKVYLLYRRGRAERILSDPAVRGFFERYGYASFELDQVLERLAERYGAYAGGEEEFPHEIGLILNIRSVMWKVLSSTGEKISCFQDTGRFTETRKRQRSCSPPTEPFRRR